jgi:glucose/mannose-6-phosphate isomerase
MLLNDHTLFQKIDSQNFIAEIDGLPDQLASAWELGQTQPLPKIDKIKQIFIAGMGGSATAADLFATYVRSACSVPIHLVHDYNLPAFARGPETLFIACSHSGNTEETLAAFDAAIRIGCTLMTISTGGALAQKTAVLNAPHWAFSYDGQSRMAIGYVFGHLLALVVRLGVIPSEMGSIPQTVVDLKSVQRHLHADVLPEKNPAKRTAGQAAGRYITVYGADYMAPVARRWASQINLMAKSGATSAEIPAADHNILAGTTNPEKVMLHTHHVFLRAKSDHPRNSLRLEMTRKAFMLEALSTDTADARGKTPLSQMWTMLLFGDYVSYYLAMMYGINPATLDALVDFDEKLKES